MEVIIWMNIPSHHQSSFFEALRGSGVNLIVRYYDKTILEMRKTQGWTTPRLNDWEAFVQPNLNALKTIPDFKKYLHVVPGYGSSFTRKLSSFLSKENVEWAHWSECSRFGIKWFLSYPLKKWYGNLVSNHALGAFGQGIMAQEDFTWWGIPKEKIGILFYAREKPAKTFELNEETKDKFNGKNVFLYIGSLCHRKGIDVLIKSFLSINRYERKDWVLVFVGADLRNGEYQKLASNFNNDGEVIFLEPIPSDQIWGLFPISKVFILPSRFDGWGVVLNEAASMGLALIGSDRVGAAHHLISPGINGFRVRSGDINSLRSALLVYINNPKLADKHGAASLEIAKAFTPERNAQRFIATIESWRAMRPQGSCPHS